jgi:hypothetical protein
MTNDTQTATRAETRLDRDETGFLIASDRVEGTAVYNRQGEKLGTIQNFMVGKRSGRVEYAVLSFGGLFGLGQKQYPLPWDTLTYNTEKGGYVVDLDKERLEKAPSFERGQEPAWDRDYGIRVYDYYGITY